MKRLVPLLAFVALAATAADTRPVLLTGEVEALDSQTIFVPPSNSSPIVIRNFLAEGTQVKKGDVVLRIDSASTTNVDQLRMDRERARARTDSETATLEVAAVEAEKALVNAQAALDRAKVEAALPKQQITALDYDRHQAELGRLETRGGEKVVSEVEKIQRGHRLQHAHLLDQELLDLDDTAQQGHRGSHVGFVDRAQAEDAPHLVELP